MPPKRQPAQPPYAMLYGSRQGGPRLYLGACLVSHAQTDAEALEELRARPLAEWFDLLEIVVNNRHI